MKNILSSVIFIVLASCQSAPKPSLTPAQLLRLRSEAHAKKYIVSTQGKITTDAAIKILHEGGNIVDAAVAASFAISVERPESTGLGGGGFMIYYEAKTKKTHVIDFRERAPEHATKKMFLDAKGNVIENKSTTGGHAIGVPGLVKGLAYVHQHWGSKKSWSKLLQPAINAAENGFTIHPHLANAIKEEQEDLIKFDSTKKIFLHDDGTPKTLGETLIQKDLAQSLKKIAINSETFYQGDIAKNIVSTVEKYKGILMVRDLKQYRVKIRKPLIADYAANGRRFQVISMSPPSSGGIHVVQILKLLEHDHLEELGFFNPQALHLMAQAMQQAFADRAKYLGDPDFVKVPVATMTSDRFLQQEREHFSDFSARSAKEVVAGEIKLPPEPDHTTHLSLMDAEGNVVVTTQSVNGLFGSKMVAEGTGIILNNTMDDFSTKPGALNLFGAVGSDANSVTAHKTPLSSMSPTIVLENGKPILALGSPNGTRIITGVAQTILNFLVFKRDLYTAVSDVRIHHQWTPDELWVENKPVDDLTLKNLEKRGYKIKRFEAKNFVEAVAFDENGLVGVADPRDVGSVRGE